MPTCMQGNGSGPYVSITQKNPPGIGCSKTIGKAELQLRGHPICHPLLAAATRSGFGGLMKDGPMHLASITWACVRTRSRD
eukprot:5623152-Amphidinium_carterae.2